MEIKVFQEVLVSNESEEDALTRDNNGSKFEFLFTGTNGWHHVKQTSSKGAISHGVYRHVVAVPESKTYTFKTFPRGIVYLRYEGGKQVSMIVGFDEYGVYTTHGSLSWEALAKHCGISTDLCQTWRDCVDGGE